MSNYFNITNYVDLRNQYHHFDLALEYPSTPVTLEHDCKGGDFIEVHGHHGATMDGVAPDIVQDKTEVGLRQFINRPP